MWKVSWRRKFGLKTVAAKSVIMSKDVKDVEFQDLFYVVKESAHLGK